MQCPITKTFSQKLSRKNSNLGNSKKNNFDLLRQLVPFDVLSHTWHFHLLSHSRCVQLLRRRRFSNDPPLRMGFMSFEEVLSIINWIFTSNILQLVCESLIDMWNYFGIWHGKLSLLISDIHQIKKNTVDRDQVLWYCFRATPKYLPRRKL